MKFNLKKGDTILLYQFMKASGLYDDYSQIRHEIRTGNVSVNEQVTTNQREEISIGDQIRHKDNHYKIVERSPIERKIIPVVPVEKSEQKSDITKERSLAQSEEPVQDTVPKQVPVVVETPMVKKNENIKHGRIPRWKSAPLKVEDKIAENLQNISRQLHTILIDSGYTISFAESCTGGMVQEFLTSYSGASGYLAGGIVSYSNEAKRTILNVKKNILTKFGAVSEETAESMVRGAQKLFDTDLAAAVTGIAGPTGGTTEKPVGTVYLAFYINGEVTYRKLNLSGDRDLIRKKATLELLKFIKESIKI